jgi:hypothetical protein
MNISEVKEKLQVISTLEVGKTYSNTTNTILDHKTWSTTFWRRYYGENRLDSIRAIENICFAALNILKDQFDSEVQKLLTSAILALESLIITYKNDSLVAEKIVAIQNTVNSVLQVLDKTKASEELNNSIIENKQSVNPNESINSINLNQSINFTKSIDFPEKSTEIINNDTYFSIYDDMEEGEIIENAKSDNDDIYTLVKNIIPEKSRPENFTLEKSLFKHSIPEHSIPEDSTPEDSLPEHSTPEDSLPEHSTPEHSRLEHSIPEHSIPEHSIPEHRQLSISDDSNIFIKDIERRIHEQKKYYTNFGPKYPQFVAKSKANYKNWAQFSTFPKIPSK